jgi:cytoskeletal protein CcmA (bactofilin family)
MINDPDFKSFNYNMLGAKSIFKGQLDLWGDTIITSKIIGDITLLDQGKLILERGSSVIGKISAYHIEIFGTVEGEIISSGIVSIRSSAQVTGKIKASKLVIYPGAIVESEADSEE